VLSTIQQTIFTKKDYNKGLTPSDLCSNKNINIEVINTETGKIYRTIREVALEYNINEKTVGEYLKDPSKSKIPIVKLTDYDKNNTYTFGQDIKNNIRLNKKVIDIITNEEFNSFEEISKKYDISKDMLSKILNYKCYNKTGLIFESDFKEGMTPNCKYKGELKEFGMKVIDTETGKIYNSIRSACKELNLCNKRQSAYLKNNELEKTKLRYLNVERQK
jgi:hypothetical protein